MLIKFEECVIKWGGLFNFVHKNNISYLSTFKANPKMGEGDGTLILGAFI